MVKKVSKNIFLSLLMSGILFMLGGCSPRHYVSKGNKNLQHKNYVDAIRHYKKALPGVKEKYDPSQVQELMFQIGEAYQEMNQFDKALPWFKDAVYQGAFNEDYSLKYAESLLNNGQKQAALEVYQTIAERQPNNLTAQKRILALNNYHPDEQVINQTHPASKINSTFSEYSPALYNNKLVFTSTRPELHNRENVRTNQTYADIFMAEWNKNTGQWQHPEPLPEIINSGKAEGTFVVHQPSQTAYFTRCEEAQRGCKIYTSHANSQTGEWEKPRIAGFEKNNDIAHPAIADDGITLYFAADMPGGFGGKDIWMVRKTDASHWGTPVNPGDNINSEFDEMFPSLAGDSLLFFASNRPEAYGGLDIFMAEIKNNLFMEPVHFDYPFNSSADDFGMLLTSEGGVFTSNRNNQKQSDDLYQFTGHPLLVTVSGKITDISTGKGLSEAVMELQNGHQREKIKLNDAGAFIFKAPVYQDYPVAVDCKGYLTLRDTISTRISMTDYPFDTLRLHYQMRSEMAYATLSGKVRNQENQLPMEGETVRLYEGDRLLDSQMTNKDGIYTFRNVAPEKSYQVKISKEGYFSDSRNITIPKLANTAIFSKTTGYDLDFELTRIQKKKEITIHNIFYDFNKATLRPESKTELNKLVSMMKETPNVIIQINAHTDARGSSGYNQQLSQKRAQSVVDYLTQKGIAADRLFAKGYGESRLQIKNAVTESQHQLNRRTTFKVLAVLEKVTSQPENKTKTTITPTFKNNLAYRVQILSTKTALKNDYFQRMKQSLSEFKLFETKRNNMYKYEFGEVATYKEAEALRNRIVSLGHKDCFLTAYYQGEKISIQEALKIERSDE